jgi:hypothetical protein
MFACRDNYCYDNDILPPDSHNESYATWIIEGTQFASLKLDPAANKHESGIWIKENASTHLFFPGLNQTMANHLIPNCSINTTYIMIDPIIPRLLFTFGV